MEIEIGARIRSENRRLLRSCEITGIKIAFKGVENTIIHHVNSTRCRYLWSRGVAIEEE